MQPTSNNVTTPLEISSRLRRLIVRGRLPHALLFIGANREITTQCAIDTARAIQCSTVAQSTTSEMGCGTCEHCRLILSNNHPDVRTHDCEKFDGDAMDVLREILASSFRRSFLGSARITILKNSHELSLAALNLLLKTLEEPRPSNYFILSTPNINLLPSTVISRAQAWFFPDDLSSMPRLEDALASTLLAAVEKVASGDIHQGVLLASKIHKECKDQMAVVLATLQHHGREQLMQITERGDSSTKPFKQWGAYLCDLAELEYGIISRNFNAQYQLAWAFERLATSV